MQYANEIDNDPLKSFQVRQSNSKTSLLVGPPVGVSVGRYRICLMIHTAHLGLLGLFYCLSGIKGKKNGWKTSYGWFYIC